MKICVTCKNEKNINEFTIDNSKPDGRYSICKQCLKEKRLLKKDNKKIYDVEYRKKNDKKLKERNKIYQKSIPNKIRASHNRKYRQKHKEKFNEWQLNYIKTNKY